MGKLSERRLVENEVIFRDVNKDVQEFVNNEMHQSGKATVKFYCECSDPDCTERIELSTHEYEKIHKNKKCFITLIGHETPEVEDLVEKNRSYQVVKKHFIPPNMKDIEAALKAING